MRTEYGQHTKCGQTEEIMIKPHNEQTNAVCHNWQKNDKLNVAFRAVRVSSLQQVTVSLLPSAFWCYFELATKWAHFFRSQRQRKKTGNEFLNDIMLSRQKARMQIKNAFKRRLDSPTVCSHLMQFATSKLHRINIDTWIAIFISQPNHCHAKQDVYDGSTTIARKF